MATVPISQFMTRIAPSVQGAPAEFQRQAVIDAISMFCKKTRAWYEIQDAFLVQSGNSDYSVDLPSGAQPMSIEAVWCGVFQLQPLNMQALQAVMPNWQTATGPRPLYYNSEIDWSGFRVFPMPTPTDILAAATVLTLRIKGSFLPTEASTTVPDFLWSKYRDVISAGAKSILMMTPSVSWFNPKLAEYHQSLFDTGVADARIEVIHGRVSGTVAVPSRRFF
jgi:hypothetical protein